MADQLEYTITCPVCEGVIPVDIFKVNPDRLGFFCSCGVWAYRLAPGVTLAGDWRTFPTPGAGAGYALREAHQNAPETFYQHIGYSGNGQGIQAA